MQSLHPRRRRALLFHIPLAMVLSLPTVVASYASDTSSHTEEFQGGFVVEGEVWVPPIDGDVVVHDGHENPLLSDDEIARIQAIADTESPGRFRGPLTGYERTLLELDTRFVRTPIEGASVSSPFGPRWGSFHFATDYPAAQGTPVYPVAHGVVSHVMTESRGGNMVVVEHMVRGERFQSAYAHLSSQSVVPGQVVSSETEIGLVGSTGFSTGPHLHLEVRVASGVQINPAAWLADGSLEFGPDPRTVAPPSRPEGGDTATPTQRPDARDRTQEERAPKEPEPKPKPSPEPNEPEQPSPKPEPEPEPEPPVEGDRSDEG